MLTKSTGKLKLGYSQCCFILVFGKVDHILIILFSKISYLSVETRTKPYGIKY